MRQADLNIGILLKRTNKAEASLNMIPVFVFLPVFVAHCTCCEIICPLLLLPLLPPPTISKPTNFPASSHQIAHVSNIDQLTFLMEFLHPPCGSARWARIDSPLIPLYLPTGARASPLELFVIVVRGVLISHGKLPVRSYPRKIMYAARII